MPWSKWIATAAILALAAAAYGCGDDDDPKSVRDASAASEAGDSCSKTPAAVASSLKTWRALSADEGQNYWYEEENCARNSVTGALNKVRVDASGAHIRSKESIERADCQALVNRYEDFKPQTFEQLYASCKTLVARECDASIEIDAQGILRSCTWEGDNDSCRDSCGEGFYLRRWGFGDAPE
jgi:hypothetical protein